MNNEEKPITYLHIRQKYNLNLVTIRIIEVK